MKDYGHLNDLSGAHPEIAAEIALMMKAEHTPGFTWPSPGETEEEFSKRLKIANIPDKPVNREEY